MNIDEFDRIVRDAEKPVIFDFWAPWCAPCRMMNPILEKSAEKYGGKVDLVKISSDQSPDLIRKLGVMSIPTLMGYQNGQPVFRKTGIQPVGEVERAFERLAGEQPQRRELSGASRFVRAGLGLAMIAVGVLIGPLYWLIVLGGLVVFSAIYDRCPIYRVMAPRIAQFIRRRFKQTENSL